MGNECSHIGCSDTSYYKNDRFPLENNELNKAKNNLLENGIKTQISYLENYSNTVNHDNVTTENSRGSNLTGNRLLMYVKEIPFNIAYKDIKNIYNSHNNTSRLKKSELSKFRKSVKESKNDFRKINFKDFHNDNNNEDNNSSFNNINYDTYNDNKRTFSKSLHGKMSFNSKKSLKEYKIEFSSDNDLNNINNSCKSTSEKHGKNLKDIDTNNNCKESIDHKNYTTEKNDNNFVEIANINKSKISSDKKQNVIQSKITPDKNSSFMSKMNLHSPSIEINTKDSDTFGENRENLNNKNILYTDQKTKMKAKKISFDNINPQINKIISNDLEKNQKVNVAKPSKEINTFKKTNNKTIPEKYLNLNKFKKVTEAPIDINHTKDLEKEKLIESNSTNIIPLTNKNSNLEYSDQILVFLIGLIPNLYFKFKSIN